MEIILELRNFCELKVLALNVEVISELKIGKNLISESINS